MTEAEIRRLYPAMRVEPHPYTGPEGHYLVFRARGEPYGLIVETDPDSGRATQLRVGTWAGGAADRGLLLMVRRLLVHGRVQGVWYRGWTVDQAKALGLDGWVRNRSDGTRGDTGVGAGGGRRGADPPLPRRPAGGAGRAGRGDGRRRDAAARLRPAADRLVAEGIAHQDRVLALRAGRDQGDRAGDQLLDAPDIFDRLRRADAARSARRRWIRCQPSITS